MRAIVVFVLMTMACSSVRHSASAPTTDNLFRSVQFDPYGPITLGEALRPDTPPPTVQGHLLALPDLQFGGTDTIYVELGADSRVKAMHFVYPDTELEERLRSYQESLGSPQSSTEADSAAGKVHHVIWEDAITKFIVGHYVAQSGVRRVSSSLIDKGKRE